VDYQRTWNKKAPTTNDASDDDTKDCGSTLSSTVSGGLNASSFSTASCDDKIKEELQRLTKVGKHLL